MFFFLVFLVFLIFEVERSSTVSAFSVAGRVGYFAERLLNAFLFIFGAVEAVLVADGLVDFVVVEVDIDFGSVASWFPADELVQMLVSHEFRYLG